MGAGQLLQRLGLSGPADERFCWRLVLALVLLYAAAFAAFPPAVATNLDEATYLNQARLAAEGRRTVSQLDALSGETVELAVSTYAPGTAIVMAPFVKLGGWRAGFVVPCLALLAAVLLTARWIQEEGRSPAFALVLLGFPPALVMGRVAMSDVPSAAWVTFGLWLFWRGLDRRPAWWLAAGLVAGSSLVFRATNPLVFAPLFAGAVLRRDRRSWALVVGGLVGVGLRLAAMYAFFGDPFFERDTYRLAPGTVGERIPLYALALLVFVPGGLVLSLAYRGRRRPEVVATIALFLAFFLLQRYSSDGTTLTRRLVLGNRYFLPLLPLMAFAMAESAPRLWGRLRARLAARRPRVEAVAGGLVGLWLAGVAAAAVGVHVAFGAWSASHAEIRDAIARTVPADAPVVTNLRATRKFIDEVDRSIVLIDRDRVAPGALATVARRHGPVFVVLLDRTDTDWYRGFVDGSAALLGGLRPAPVLVLDRRVTPTERLHIWRYGGERSSPPGDGDERPRPTARTGRAAPQPRVRRRIRRS